MSIELLAIGGTEAAPISSVIARLKLFSPPIVVAGEAVVGGEPFEEARDKDPILPGHLYVAPAGYQLLIDRVASGRDTSTQGTFALSVERPSLEAFFEAVGEAYGRHAVGILLPPLQSDGLAGLRRLAEWGGRSFVVRTSETPLAAADSELTSEIGMVSLDDLADAFAKLEGSEEVG